MASRNVPQRLGQKQMSNLRMIVRVVCGFGVIGWGALAGEAIAVAPLVKTAAPVDPALTHAAFVVPVAASRMVSQEPAPAPEVSVDLLRIQARQTTTDAFQLYESKKYREAAEGYSAAVKAWEALAARLPSDVDAARQKMLCQHNRRFCYLKPAEVEGESARVAMESGEIDEAHRRYLAAVEACEWAAGRIDEPLLAANRIAYLNKAGIVLVKEADRLVAAGDPKSSLEWYDRAAAYYQPLTELHPESEAFSKNLTYIRLRRQQAQQAIRTEVQALIEPMDFTTFFGTSLPLIDREHPTVVVVWSHESTVSRERLLSINQWYRESKDRGLRVIAVCADRLNGATPEQLTSIAEWSHENLEIPWGWADEKWSSAVGIPPAFPSVMLIDSKGVSHQSTEFSKGSLDALQQAWVDRMLQ